MAWNPNERGNPAWLSREAKKHGGTEKLIKDIYNDGFQNGKTNGAKKGASIATLAIGGIYATYKGISLLIKKHKDKEQKIHEQAEASKKALLQMDNEDSKDNQNSDSNNDNE